MTTLTQSELDDMWQEIETKGYRTAQDDRAMCLLDHIARLTAERDEALEKLRFSESKREEDYKKYVLDMADAADRIAELEAQPSAWPPVTDANVELAAETMWNVFRTSSLNSSEIVRQTSWSELVAGAMLKDAVKQQVDVGRQEARAVLNAVFGMAQPSAQFVAGMRRAAQIIKDNCETYSTAGGDERKALSPRRSGDLAGLSYAHVILAEAAALENNGIDKPQRSMFIDGWFTQEHERRAAAEAAAHEQKEQG